MRPKALELWVMAVSPRRAPEHGAREQAFSPERNQTLGVEVLGMKRPETHDVAGYALRTSSTASDAHSTNCSTVLTK